MSCASLRRPDDVRAGGGAFLLLVAVLSSCAVVDPSADYERAAGEIEAAMGAPVAYRPGEEDAASARVRSLLEDGLSAAEAVEVGLLNSASVQAAFLEIGMARADVVQAGLLSNPSLGGLIRFPLDGGSANVEAGLAQNLIELWQLPERKRMARDRLESTVLRIAYEVARFVAETRQTYVAAVAAAEALRVEEENLETTRALLDLTLARQAAGAATEVDANSARAELLEGEMALRAARLESFERRRLLALRLGLALSPDELTLSDPLVPLPDIELALPDLLAAAERYRLDLRETRADAGVAAHEVALSRRRFLRSVEAGVALESEGSDDVALGPSIDLELPLFDQNQAQIARARLRHQQAQRLLEGLAVTVVQEVRGAYERFRGALEIARMHGEELLPLSEANLELAGEAFRAGKMGFLSVLEAQKKLLAERRQYVDRLAELARTLPDLEAACGRPLRVLAAEPEPAAPTEEGTERADE